MYNNNTAFNRFTRLTLEQPGKKLVWEVPREDVSGVDMCNALKTILVGMGFLPQYINSVFANYLDEYASTEFEVLEKNNDTP